MNADAVLRQAAIGTSRRLSSSCRWPSWLGPLATKCFTLPPHIRRVRHRSAQNEPSHSHAMPPPLHACQRRCFSVLACIAPTCCLRSVQRWQRCRQPQQRSTTCGTASTPAGEVRPAQLSAAECQEAQANALSSSSACNVHCSCKSSDAGVRIA